MTLTLVVIAWSLHVLIWEKLPDWGNWFNWLVERLPAPLAYLYQAWRCPYCFGFWAALALQVLTGQKTLPALQVMPEYLGVLALPLSYFLDALATAMLVMMMSLIQSAVSGPAIKGFELTQSFKQQMKSQAE